MEKPQNQKFQGRIWANPPTPGDYPADSLTVLLSEWKLCATSWEIVHTIMESGSVWSSRPKTTSMQLQTTIDVLLWFFHNTLMH